MKLTAFYNETLAPLGLKILWDTMLLEFPGDSLNLLYDDPVFSHPSVRCSCGSSKVVNIGIPRNNGRYFLCRRCRTSFKVAGYRQEWDEMYKSCGRQNPICDSWLDRYGHLLEESKDTPILDLGAGYGNDTLHLRRNGFMTLSGDYSAEALLRLRSLDDSAPLICFDILDGLPFPDHTFKVIVANLSLHYFTWNDTKRIIEDVQRVLKNYGHLLCRVKSVGDIQYKSMKGTRIEDNYYDINGKRKRFFTGNDVRRLFRGWNILSLTERSIQRFEKSKTFWEVDVQKI